MARRHAPLSTYTFRLGRHGRLGNQLFQIAGTVAIARTMDADAVFAKSWPYRRYFSLPDELYAGPITVARCAEAWPLATGIDESARIYLQDPGIWGASRATIRAWLQPSELAHAAAVRCSAELLSLPHKTALHVRRGDFLTDRSHRPCPPSYYEEAAELIRSQHPSTQFVVFSDDIAWCRRSLSLPDAHFVEGNPDWLDLTLMSHCDQHICANSSFSWWGAFLSSNPSPIVPWLSGASWPPRMPQPKGWREIEVAL